MRRTSDYDLIVAGAGPAGSTAAAQAAGAGHRVLLVDRRIFPRPKLCAGLLTEKSIRLIDRLRPGGFTELCAAESVHTASREYEVHSRTTCLHAGRLETPFHLVRRSLYDAFWVDHARQSGAEILLGTAVREVQADTGMVTLADGRQTTGTHIVAADGANSRVRTLLTRTGALRGIPSSGTATALELFVADHEAKNAPPSIHFGDVPTGYAWDFPSAEGRVLGICALPSTTTQALHKAFRAFLLRRGYRRPDSSGIRGHLLPYGGFMRRPGAGRVLLCGDACGLADPLLGEGIYYAHQSGRMAGLAVSRSLATTEPTLPLYLDLLKEPVLRELRWALYWRTLLFTLLAPGGYRPLGLALRLLHDRLEETIQGRRSFRFLRSLSAWDTVRA